jgi:hypothetical protein
LKQPKYKDYQAKRAERERRRQELLIERWWWLKQREPVARFTLYIAAFTVVLAAVSLLQWCELRSSGGQTDRLIGLYEKQFKQLKKQTSDTHVLAIAARKQASAAQRLAEQAQAQTGKMGESIDRTAALVDATTQLAVTAKDSMTKVQRAFIFTGTVDILPVIRDYQLKWGFSLRWENAGTTPTRNLHIYLRCPNRFEPIADPFHVATMNEWSSADRVIGPKQTISGPMCEFPADSVAKMEAGQIHIYLAARAEYHDIFSNTPMRITEYCAELIRINGDVNNPTISLGATPIMCHSGHNCADEDCQRDLRRSR